jgi:cyclohexanone monooxygenase
VKGIEDFKGRSFHSSRWDYGYSGGNSKSRELTGLADKRVGILGTGATAVQIVPNVANYAKETYVFQRTPSSISVRGNRPTDPAWKASLQKGWQTERMDNFDNLVNGRSMPEDLVNDGWTDLLFELLGNGPTRPQENPEKAAAERQMLDFVKMEGVRARCDEVIKDKETADSLKPWYNVLCKRPCFHDEYLQAFNQENVHLVDTKGKSASFSHRRTSYADMNTGVGIERITEKGIVANGKEYELDLLIYATGFELATDWTHRSNMELYGREGKTFTECWKNGPRTFHGWTVRDFPNCFLTGVVQATLTPNFLHASGVQAKHFAYVIKKCMQQGIRTIEPTAEAEQEWINTILSSVMLRVPFFAECTPGYCTLRHAVRFWDDADLHRQ